MYCISGSHVTHEGVMARLETCTFHERWAERRTIKQVLGRVIVKMFIHNIQNTKPPRFRHVQYVKRLLQT